MRIEILVDNEEPRIYPLDRPKIMVGSNESCDIVIAHKSISRKHLLISGKDDKYFVADQGSTNGSYINEHRLVPGSAAEFSSFFPVRLGDNVLMTLLSDEEAQDLGPDSDFNTQDDASPVRDESTKMISLKDLHKSSTAGLVQKRTETVTKRKSIKKAAPPVKKKDAASNVLMGFIGFLIIAGAALYQYLNKEEAMVVIAEKKAAAVVVDTRPIKRVEEGNIPTAESIVAVAKNAKCSTDLEKSLCITLPLIYQEKWGTVLMDKTVLILANLKYLEDAKAYVKAPAEASATPAEWNAYQMDLNLVALMLWIRDNIPLEVKKIEGLNDLSLTIAFVDIVREPPGFVGAAVFVPESLLRLRQRIQDKHFADAKNSGASEFSYAIDYLRFL